MNLRIFFTFSCVFLFSCRSQPGVPESVIQPKEMKSLLWDVIRAQNLSRELARKDSLIDEKEENKQLTEKVFRFHKVTEGRFNKSYNWYVSHPDELSKILDSLYAQKQRDQINPGEEAPATPLLKRHQELIE